MVNEKSGSTIPSSSNSSNDNIVGDVRFIDLLFGFSSMALRFMGYEAGGEEAVQPNRELCKQNISCLELLKEKTNGNLTTEEESTLNELLADLRRKFLSIFPK